MVVHEDVALYKHASTVRMIKQCILVTQANSRKLKTYILYFISVKEHISQNSYKMIQCTLHTTIQIQPQDIHTAMYHTLHSRSFQSTGLQS